MNINSITGYANFSGKKPKFAEFSENIASTYKVADVDTFYKRDFHKESQEEGCRIDYNSLLEIDTKRQKTIPELREAYQQGEDISKDREKLILSRIVRVPSIAQKFTQKHPEFNKEDIEQDLIYIAIKATDNELFSTNGDREYKFGSYFDKRQKDYFASILRKAKNAEDSVIKQYLKVQAEESAPKEIYAGMEKDELKHDIEEALKKLKPRYKEILTLRYGLDGQEPMKFEQIRKEMSTTRQNVCEREDFAIRAFRSAYKDIQFRKMYLGKNNED